MALKINEAINLAKGRGIDISKQELAALLWPNSGAGARVNFSNMISGRSIKINVDNVGILCNTLGVSADFLFGLTDDPTPRTIPVAAIRELLGEIGENVTALKKIVK